LSVGRTGHKNIYEISLMGNRVCYRYGPLVSHGTRTVTKVFSDEAAAEQDILANLADKFEKGYRTAFISDPHAHIAKAASSSRKRAAGASTSQTEAKKQKTVENEPTSVTSTSASASSSTPPEPTPASRGQETAADIVEHEAPGKAEQEEGEMDHLDQNMKMAYPVDADPQAPSSVSNAAVEPQPSLPHQGHPSSHREHHGEGKPRRERAAHEPSDLTIPQLNAELEKEGLDTTVSIKRKMALLTLAMMKRHPVERHHHELGCLASGGRVLTEHLFKGELRWVSNKETREFHRSLQKITDESLRERFNADEANQLVFRSVKNFTDEDLEKLIHYLHSLKCFINETVEENKGFLVYLK